jgi:hypothetical protein
MECGRKFYTTQSAERATFNGCPGCGGSDIDIYVYGAYKPRMTKSRKRQTYIERPQEKKHIFIEIGERAGLRGNTLNRFLKFAMLWWGRKSFDPMYVSEWADRFAKQKEYMMADDERRGFLVMIDGKNGSRSRYFDQLILYGWDYQKAFDKVNKETPRARKTTTKKRKRK